MKSVLSFWTMLMHLLTIATFCQYLIFQRRFLAHEFGEAQLTNEELLVTLRIEFIFQNALKLFRNNSEHFDLMAAYLGLLFDVLHFLHVFVTFLLLSV